MKTRAEYFIVLFSFILIVLSVGCSTAQRNAQMISEAEKVVINVKELGKKVGVLEKEVVLPNGKQDSTQEWGKVHIKKAIAELKYCFSKPENTYLLSDIPEPWITVALMEALQPLKVLHLLPDGVELDSCDLKRGQQASNYDIVFEIVEDGDNIFINLNSDRPEAATIGHHTFDVKDLCKVVIPEIPTGKHVFIHGKGTYCVTVCVARNYLKDSKSVSLAAHDSPYTCAVSKSNEREAGDVTPRTLPNNL